MKLFVPFLGIFSLATLTVWGMQIKTLNQTQNTASVFFAQSITTNDLQKKYQEPSSQRKIKVLVMPGHEPDYGGAEYRDLKERDLAVDLGVALASYLSTNSHYEVIMSRGKGAWNPSIQNYFDTNWDRIAQFRLTKKSEMAELVSQGKIQIMSDGVEHNSLPTTHAIRLFGINLWANENAIDITIHVHFNDYNRASKPGKYSGFAIYIPERQYSNAPATRVVSGYIYNRLAKFFARSDLPKENNGLIEDQDLVAVGQSNSSDGVSMLIEYGYIYEDAFQNREIREQVFKEMAYQTYLGLEDFFGNNTNMPGTTFTVPETTPKNGQTSTTLSLQGLLTDQGFYPPMGKTKNDCPLSGYMGPCTKEALKNFQEQYGISGGSGSYGEKTEALLRSLIKSN